MSKEADKKQGEEILENYIHENECNEYDHSGCSYPNNIVPDYDAQEEMPDDDKIRACNAQKTKA